MNLRHLLPGFSIPISSQLFSEYRFHSLPLQKGLLYTVENTATGNFRLTLCKLHPSQEDGFSISASVYQVPCRIAVASAVSTSPILPRGYVHFQCTCLPLNHHSQQPAPASLCWRTCPQAAATSWACTYRLLEVSEDLCPGQVAFKQWLTVRETHSTSCIQKWGISYTVFRAFLWYWAKSTCTEKS